MTSSNATAEDVHLVDPARFSSGAWCYRTHKTVGRGDIYASYCADRIGMGQPIRKPFVWKGTLWACVGMSWVPGAVTARAYRLVPAEMFEGTAVRHAEKGAAAARADPLGFYHGVIVAHAREAFVLRGPPAAFAPGGGEQLSLF